MWLSLTWLAGATLFLQTPPNEPKEGVEPPPPPRGPAWREQRQERMQAYLQATPQERREMRGRRIVQRMTRVYDLDDAQRQQVADEVHKMQAEYYQQLGPHAAEYEQLEDQMARFWAKQSEAPGRLRERRPWRDPEFQKLRDQLREIRQAHPFDMEQAFKRIEALLPADQAAQGRERREAMRARMRDGPPGRGEGFQRRAGRGRGDVAPPESPADAARQAPGDLDAPASLPPAPRVHPWEVYVRQFEQRHDLDPAQKAAVRGILKEMIERETAYRRAKGEAFSEARRIESPGEREARLKSLQQPVDEMFAELQSRLDELLTAEQRGTP